MCFKLYQFKRITWWCMSILQFIIKYVMQSDVKFVLLEKIIKKNGLPLFALSPPLGGGSNANFGRPCTLIHTLPRRTPCRLFIHELFFGPVDLHLLV